VAADNPSLDTEQRPAESIVEEPASASNTEETITVDLPAWQHLELTDARTGEIFSLADFEGKTIFVEPFATWCGNCRRQLTNVRDAKLQLSSDDVVFVALSVETTIDNSTLASYADGQVFDWHFAVATPDLLRHLVDEFGRVITNPPATPHFIIRPDGTTTELVTGIETAGQIVAQIVAAQG
jgi:thiol-disulfide isomerase/thioredoxin